jgi:hypothetical protein
MAVSEMTIKVVKVSVGARRGYSRWVLRLVRCRADQRGYRNESGVAVLRESELFCASKRGPRSY